jgi:NAD(P)-dependent dehydrogenase (short-subunit alcohol dehydrogenase family)
LLNKHVLSNQKVIIIGGSSGIGLATAQKVSNAGADVVIASRSIDKLEKAKLQINGNVTIHALEVTNEKEVVDFFARTGSFDHLIMTAATGMQGAFLELDTQLAKEAFTSKFWGQYHAAKYGAPFIKEGGSITFFSGALSQKPLPGLSVLAAINSAVETLSRALAIELSPIRVNTVSPGTVVTPAYEGMPEKQRTAYFTSIADRLPAKRVGLPDDIAEAVLLLLTNPFMTGSVLEINGGHPLV